MADRYEIVVRQTGPMTFVANNGSAQVTVASDEFQPTELFLASLGGCMVETMQEYAQRNGILLGDISATLSCDMANRPRRIARINIVYHLPGGDPTQLRREALVRAGDHCTIHQLLKMPPEFVVSLEGAESA